MKGCVGYSLFYGHFVVAPLKSILCGKIQLQILVNLGAPVRLGRVSDGASVRRPLSASLVRELSSSRAQLVRHRVIGRKIQTMCQTVVFGTVFAESSLRKWHEVG